MEEVGQVGYAQGVTVGGGGVDGASARTGETAGMARFILKAV